MRYLGLTVSLIANAAVLESGSASAQRALPASSREDVSGVIGTDTEAVADPWMQRSQHDRYFVRARHAAVGGLVGSAVAGAIAYAALSGKHNPEHEGQTLAAVGAIGLSEILGVSIGAAGPGGPGGPGDGACTAHTRHLRSFGGTLAGTAGGILVTAATAGFGALLFPVAQVGGAVLSLRGC